MDDWINRKIPDVLRTIFSDYIHVCIICYVLKLLAQLPCKQVPKKESMTQVKMLCLSIQFPICTFTHGSNILTCLCLKLYYFAACGFHQSRFHLEINTYFTTRPLKNEYHTHTHIHPLTSMSNISPLTGACIGSTGKIFAQRSPGPRDHPPTCFPSTLPMVTCFSQTWFLAMKKNIQQFFREANIMT